MTTIATRTTIDALLRSNGPALTRARYSGLYFTELATDSLKKRSPDGSIVTIVQDPRLDWVDAPALDGEWIWLPVPQMDRVPLFNGGVSKVEWPVRLYRHRIEKAPAEAMLRTPTLDDSPRVTAASGRGMLPAISAHMTTGPALYRLDAQPIEQMSPLIQRQYLHGAQSTFVKWIMKKGAVVPLHHHVNEQITWIVQGEAEVYSQGRKYVLRVGDIMIITPPVDLRRSRRCR